MRTDFLCMEIGLEEVAQAGIHRLRLSVVIELFAVEIAQRHQRILEGDIGCAQIPALDIGCCTGSIKRRCQRYISAYMTIAQECAPAASIDLIGLFVIELYTGRLVIAVCLSVLRISTAQSPNLIEGILAAYRPDMGIFIIAALAVIHRLEHRAVEVTIADASKNFVLFIVDLTALISCMVLYISSIDQRYPNGQPPE